MTPLHMIGDTLRELLGLIPLIVVRILFVAVPAGVLVWMLRLPAEQTTEEPAANWFTNLKIWAALALIIQILIYSFV